MDVSTPAPHYIIIPHFCTLRVFQNFLVAMEEAKAYIQTGELPKRMTGDFDPNEDAPQPRVSPTGPSVLSSPSQTPHRRRDSCTRHSFSAWNHAFWAPA